MTARIAGGEEELPYLSFEDFELILNAEEASVVTITYDPRHVIPYSCLFYSLDSLSQAFAEGVC